VVFAFIISLHTGLSQKSDGWALWSSLF
jgi:hypothetical protein